MDESVSEQRHLLSLLRKACRLSEQLLDFTRNNYSVFSKNDAAAITGVLDNREKHIRTLTQLENEINLILERSGQAGGRLAPEAEQLRSSVRSAVDSVFELDLKAAKDLNANLTKYRELTMNTRKKKNISAYIRSNALIQADTSAN